mmetsp:Transcript_15000/g.21774  ORF Transcript_15000/g.21774 Transcript_15000/m.21774 type:complete len:266 (-) Transcript_15000:170-967(-)
MTHTFFLLLAFARHHVPPGMLQVAIGIFPSNGSHGVVYIFPSIMGIYSYIDLLHRCRRRCSRCSGELQLFLCQFGLRLLLLLHLRLLLCGMCGFMGGCYRGRHTGWIDACGRSYGRCLWSCLWFRFGFGIRSGLGLLADLSSTVGVGVGVGILFVLPLRFRWNHIGLLLGSTKHFLLPHVHIIIHIHILVFIAHVHAILQQPQYSLDTILQRLHTLSISISSFTHSISIQTCFMVKVIQHVIGMQIGILECARGKGTYDKCAIVE